MTTDRKWVLTLQSSLCRLPVCPEDPGAGRGDPSAVARRCRGRLPEPQLDRLRTDTGDGGRPALGGLQSWPQPHSVGAEGRLRAPPPALECHQEAA